MVIRKIFNPSTNVDHLGAWSPFLWIANLRTDITNFSWFVSPKNKLKKPKIIPVTFEFSILWSKLAWTLIDVVYTSLLMNKQIVYHQRIIYVSFCFSRIKALFLWVKKKKKIKFYTPKNLVWPKIISALIYVAKFLSSFLTRVAEISTKSN